MQQKIQKTLEDVFGYSSFRFEQEDIINQVIAKEDCLVIMPTGGGKSLCYQIPAIVSDGFAVVVSPLIALMNDQVASLKQLGINAATLHSNVVAEDRQKIYKNIESGTLKLLYVSPERLLAENFILYLKQQEVSFFAIDEAHCVSVWGNDFRPDYVALKAVKEEFPRTNIIALTATADFATQKDIVKQLKLPEALTYLSSFERHNISVEARPGQQRIQQILDWANTHRDQSGIVYCLSRKNTESVASKLIARGFNAAFYHAGMDANERDSIQRKFTEDDIKIVCATIAFGMGIDKPNIRWVIHYSMPKNLEGYYQEIGRAGRDGEPAKALLFYSWGDFLNLQKFIDEGQGDPTFQKVQTAKLERMWQYANSQNCRTNFVLNYFGEYRSKPCGHCDNCITPPKILDGTTYAKMAISGIIRCKERIGMNLLIDMLRGSYRKEITEIGLDKIKTFGVGRIVPYKHWSSYITQMINQGIIQIDFSDYSKLKVTPLSKDVLDNTLKVELAEYQDVSKIKKVKPQKTEIAIEDFDDDLFSKLKVWRRRIAIKKNVPSYIIMNDKTLKQIAASLPKNDHELLSVNGIGQQKLKDYGKDILELVSAG